MSLPPLSNDQKMPLGNDLVYELESRPPFGPSLLAAIQHIFAIVLSVMAPPAIVAGALGVPAPAISYLISMSLLFSGIGIWCQVRRPFGIGSGMLSIQATSFAFPGALIATGTILMREQGLGWEACLATLFGISFAGSVLVMLGSRIMHILRRAITQTVAGVTVMMIGVSLVQIGAVDIAGGFAAKANGTFGSVSNLSLGAFTILVIVLVNRCKQPLLRMASLVIGITAGFVLGIFMDKVNWSLLTAEHTWFVMPVPFKFGFFDFDVAAFATISILFLVVLIETIGDLTATSAVSGQALKGPVYRSRVAGGILCDGLLSAIGSIFGCFPMATFSQNNGIIQLSGVASRKVGIFCGALLAIFSIFPVIVVLFTLMPRPVLGGTLVVLFGMIACSGIRLLQTQTSRRESIVIAVSLGVGLACMSTPDAYTQLPRFFQLLFSSAIATSGLTAVLVHLVLPKTVLPLNADQDDDE